MDSDKVKTEVEFDKIKNEYRRSSKKIANRKKRIINALLNAIEILIITAIIPIIAFNTENKLAVILYFSFVVLITFFLRLWKDKERLQAKLKMTVGLDMLIIEHENLDNQLKEIEGKYKDGEYKLKSLGDALTILANALKETLDYNFTAKINFKRDHIINERHYSTNSYMKYLRYLCSYVIEIIKVSLNKDLLRKKNESVPNFEDLDFYLNHILFLVTEEGKLCQILPHVKSTEVEENKVAVKSAKVALKRFNEKINLKTRAEDSYLVIPDTDEDRILILEDTLKKNVKSLISTIIYFKHENETKVLGVLHINSKLKWIFNDESLKVLKPYFKPVYRLLAAKLVILLKEPKIYDKIKPIKSD